MLVFPPDGTLLIQLLSFFLLLAVLERWLFRPFAAVLAEREGQTEGAVADAEHTRAHADELRIRVEREIAETRNAAMVGAEASRREIRAEDAAIYDRAKQDAGARLATLRAGIETERRAASETLRKQAGDVAAGMVASVLGNGGRS